MDFSSAETFAMPDVEPNAIRAAAIGEQMLGLLINDLCDDVDHPEIWTSFQDFLDKVPGLEAAIESSLHLCHAPRLDVRTAYTILVAMARAVSHDPEGALALLGDLSIQNSESPLVQGAVFHIQSLVEPHNPKFDLSTRFCTRPFLEIDVLERSTHLCCASWLNLSIGDMSDASNWQDIWNSHNAERIRASIHDGSYRHCNKTVCPWMQASKLPSKDEVAALSPGLDPVIKGMETRLQAGPERINLAYDRTCNLSCPSCRKETFAADTATRDRFARLQKRIILPMLKDAKTVFITGSGDPFASKNFRQLIDSLGAEQYPDLRFIVMTNGMLFTRREWDRFPALHNRVQSLRISIDGATKTTHELLRRGSNWEVMQENLTFAAELLHQGFIDELHLAYTVQAENYREMGDAVDLAVKLNATYIYFGRITNWGTFSPAEYRAKAIFQPGHPEHTAFLESMRDPRLTEKCVVLGNLLEFLPTVA